MQHLTTGWAFGASGYAFQQLGDDSGTGATTTKAALGASSLQARVFGVGPIVTYSGAAVFGRKTSFLAKYYTEFEAKRRIESNTLWLNMSFTF